MSSKIQQFAGKNGCMPPKWLSNNMIYEVIMGSFAYGTSEDGSDIDIYGVCIPPKQYIFPTNVILHFGKQHQIFEVYTQHGINDDQKKKEYDFSVYNISKYFNLLMQNNPNIIDSLFVPENCITYTSYVGDLIRQNRHIFLHKGCRYKFSGYAFSQLSKLSRNPIGKRKELVEKYGYDTKFATHIFRLLLECEQILTDGTLDLQLNKELLKSVRRGDLKKEEIEKWAVDKTRTIERLYETSKLPLKPDEDKIRNLLLDCLEHHYGSIKEYENLNGDRYKNIVERISEIINEKY